MKFLLMTIGNPIYEGMTKKAAAPQVLKILPSLKTLDGEMAGLGGDDSAAGPVKDASTVLLFLFIIICKNCSFIKFGIRSTQQLQTRTRRRHY